MSFDIPFRPEELKVVNETDNMIISSKTSRCSPFVVNIEYTSCLQKTHLLIQTTFELNLRDGPFNERPLGRMCSLIVLLANTMRPSMIHSDRSTVCLNC